MGERPRRMRPSWPGDESGVLEVPSLTDQMNVAMDVEGETYSGQLEGATLTSDFSHANANTPSSSEGLGLLAPACPSGVPDRSRRHTLSS
jgi:hypothetical protein